MPRSPRVSIAREIADIQAVLLTLAKDKTEQLYLATIRTSGRAVGCRTRGDDARCRTLTRWRGRDVVSIVGVGFTLYGTARGLGPHGGTGALLPPRGVRALRWVRTRPGAWWRWFERTVLRRHRDVEVRPPVAVSAAFAGRGTLTAEAIVIPNPVTDTEAFMGKLAAQFGAVSGDLAAARRDLDQERTAREAAEQQLLEALTAGLETKAAEIKHLDLSGLRWQFVGATFVVVGIAVEGIWG